MKQLFYLFSFILISGTAFGQNFDDEQFSLSILKNHVLLVRIDEHGKRMEALKKAGKTGEIEKLKRQIQHDDLEIRTVFKAEYTFGQVYYFYSSSSTSILEGDWKGKIFNADSTLVDLSPCPYLMAQFGETQDAHIKGLVIYSPSSEGFNQMPSSFPYFVRRTELLGLIKRSTGEMVKSWNETLNASYKSQ